MSKKEDLPAMPFYFGDWRKAPEIRALDLDVRMIWFEMLGYMWESTPRGYLIIKGKPVITPVIARLIGVDITKMEQALEQMEEFDVFSRTNDGTIYSRKMVADEEKRLKKSKAGRLGMEKRYSDITPVITLDITKGITFPEYENENENIGIEGVQGKEGVNKFVDPVEKVTGKPLVVQEGMWKQLANDTCGLFGIEPINNARTYMDIHNFVKEAATDAKRFEYLKSQTYWYIKLVQGGRPKVSPRNWIADRWNEMDYKKLWQESQKTFGRKNETPETPTKITVKPFNQ